MKQASIILDIIKQATLADLILISLLLLPFVFEAWVRVFQGLGFGQDESRWLFGILLLFYAAILAVLLWVLNRRKQRDIVKDQILSYLTDRGLYKISYDRVRKRLNAEYSDKFLDSVIAQSPTELRHVVFKSGNRGVGRIVEEADEESDY